MKTKEVEVLQETYKTPDSNYDGAFSKTAQFMTPAIGIKVTNELVFKFFKNAYLNDVNHEHEYIRPIFMLFSTKSFKDKDWIKVYSILTKAKTFITEYDIGIQNDEYLLMLVYSVPEEFKEDYYNFKQGRYSLFSDEYRKKFPKFMENSKEKKINIHWQIINKDPELIKEIEEEFDCNIDNSGDIWERPRKKREYYRYIDAAE